MLIFVSDGSRCNCIEVGLDKSCYPRIASHVCKGQEIEPTVWFKVLVLDSISVNCRQKEVSWTYLWKRGGGEATSSPETLTCRMDLFEMGRIECYDFDDEAEEMFETARQLAKESPESGSLGEDDCGIVLRLLNSYLLPTVKFEVSSLPFVRDAYEDLRRDVAWVDRRVETVSEYYAKAKDEHSAMLRRLLPCLEKDLMTRAEIDASILTAIRDDLKKEEKRAQESFRDRGLAVEGRRSENPAEGDKEMERLRQERKMAHDYLLLILNCRELLRDAIIRREEEFRQRTRSLTGSRSGDSLSRSWSNLDLPYAQYCQARQTVRGTYRQQESIFEAKVLIASVRESLRETMEQLECGVACEGATMRKHCSGTAQALGGEMTRKYTESQVVKTKVNIIMTDPTSPQRKMHRDFCETMKERLQAIVKMLKDNQGVVCHRCNSLAVANAVPMSVEDDDGFDETYDDCDFGIDILSDMIRPCISDIKDHSQKISASLVKVISGCGNGQYWLRKVQIRYDKLFYEEIGPFVEAVYQAYYVHNRALERRLAYLSVQDPQEMNLGLRVEPWHCVFDSRHARLTPVRRRPLSQDNDTWLGTDSDLTFDNYFGSVRNCLEEVLCQNTPLTKLQNLTAALRKVMSSMSTLRARLTGEDEGDPIGADDMMPILVIVLTRLNCSLVVAIKRQCHMLSDVVPDFLSTGCYGYALAQFSAAIQVLEKGPDEVPEKN